MTPIWYSETRLDPPFWLSYVSLKGTVAKTDLFNSNNQRYFSKLYMKERWLECVLQENTLSVLFQAITVTIAISVIVCEIY